MFNGHENYLSDHVSNASTDERDLTTFSGPTLVLVRNL